MGKYKISYNRKGTRSHTEATFQSKKSAKKWLKGRERYLGKNPRIIKVKS